MLLNGLVFLFEPLILCFVLIIRIAPDTVNDEQSTRYNAENKKKNDYSGLDILCDGFCIHMMVISLFKISMISFLLSFTIKGSNMDLLMLVIVERKIVLPLLTNLKKIQSFLLSCCKKQVISSSSMIPNMGQLGYSQIYKLKRIIAVPLLFFF